MEKEIEEIIKEEFGLKTNPSVLQGVIMIFSAVWFVAFGSALRGLISRCQDVLI